MLSCEYCKIFKNSFFIELSLEAAFGYSNQSKIFWEITALKFQGQHAAHSIFVYMKVYALHLKQKSTVGVSHEILQNFRIATFGNNFGGRSGGGLLLKRKQRKRVLTNPCGFSIHFSIWIMLSIFINLRKGFYYQDFKGRNIQLLLGR